MHSVEKYVGARNSNKKKEEGDGEISECLRTLNALVEEPGLCPSTHMVAHNCLPLTSRISDVLF